MSVVRNVEKGLLQLLCNTFTTSKNIHYFKPTTMNQRDNINMYFQKFILENAYPNQEDANIKETWDYIAETKFPTFDNDWNCMMLLVATIENIYCISKIEFSHNYCRFEFDNEQAEQNKGGTLIEAVYRVCYSTLARFWKKPEPSFDKGIEPFEEADLL